MSTLRPGSGRGYDIDLTGLEESTVDSDDEDVSSVNTEVLTFDCLPTTLLKVLLFPSKTSG